MFRRRSLFLALILASITLAWLATGAADEREGFVSAAASGRSADALPVLEQRPSPRVDVPAARPGELIVGFAPSASTRARVAAIADTGGSVVRHLRLLGYSLVRVPSGREEEFTHRLLTVPGVKTVERNLIRRASFTPDDPGYPFQWHFPKIGMPAAWDRVTGAGATVAVLDTGVAFEDCSAAVCGDTYFQAPDFGGTSFVTPYDVIGDDTHPNDEDGHGTHVASTIAEATNNAFGGAGIAFDASIMPVQILGAGGVGTVADEIDGIMWAKDHGADVISMSLGGPGGIAAEEAAINNAVANGVIVVAAAGNGGEDGIGDATLDCPACYPATIAVGATRIDQARAPYSNYGTGVGGHTLDLVAPGGDLSVDQNADTYPDGVLQQTFEHGCVGGPPDFSVFVLCFLQGTSMATPHVSGVAALLRSLDSNLTAEEIRNIMTGTATDVGPAGYDLQYGHGEVNAAEAVEAAQLGGADTDADGCTDLLEIGPNPLRGGERDPNYFWDFLDVPAGLPPLRDKYVSIGDISSVVARFGAFHDPPLSKAEALAEAMTPPPPAPAYHAAYDRGSPIPGQNLWNLQPPNGSVSVSDIGAVVAQFGHSCA